MCLIINPVCDVKKLVGGVAHSVFNDIANAFAGAATKLTTWMWSFIADTTRVDLAGGWFHTMLGVTSTLAGVIVLAVFVLEIIRGVLRREPGVLSRATVGVGSGVIGAVAAIGVVEALLVATDALSDGVVRTAGVASIGKLGAAIAPAGAIAGIAEPALILMLALGYLLASFLVWAMFVIRKAMIIVAAVFAPVAFSGAASRATSGWVRKWVEFTIAMIFSKLVVVVIFTLALSLVGSPGSGLAAVGNLFSGLTMLIVGCFTPWMLLRLVHFLGGEMVAAQQHGVMRTVVAAGTTPVSMARTGAATFAGVVGGASTAAASAAPSFAASSAAGAGRSTAVPPKSLTNGDIRKPVGGSGPASGPTPGDGGSSPPPTPPSGPTPSGPTPPSGPTAPRGPATPRGPRTSGPTFRPQPASAPSGA